MKLRALVLLNAFVLALTAHGQLLMKAGDSYVFQFKRLDLYGVDFTSSGGAASWITGMQGADGEDSLRMEIFEGGIEEPALAERVMDLRQGAAIIGHPTAWADHAGAVRITVLEGSFTLSELIVRHLRPNPSGTFDLFQVRVPVVPIDLSFAEGAANITFTAFAINLFSILFYACVCIWWATLQHSQTRESATGAVNMERQLGMVDVNIAFADNISQGNLKAEYNAENPDALRSSLA